MDLKSSKVRPKIVQNPGGLGVAWGVFRKIWVRFYLVNCPPGTPKTGKGALSWSKSNPSWFMLALRRRLGAQLGGFGVDFGVDFGSIREHFGTWVG